MPREVRLLVVSKFPGVTEHEAVVTRHLVGHGQVETSIASFTAPLPIAAANAFSVTVSCGWPGSVIALGEDSGGVAAVRAAG